MATQQRNKAVFRRYLDAFNRGDLEAFAELVTDGYVNHDPLHPDPAPGPAGLTPIVRELREQAPAPLRQIQIERFADGRIAEHWRATGSR